MQNEIENKPAAPTAPAQTPVSTPPPGPAEARTTAPANPSSAATMEQSLVSEVRSILRHRPSWPWLVGPAIAGFIIGLLAR